MALRLGRRRRYHRFLASGDAHRVWFIDLVAVLRAEWSSCTTWQGRIALRDRLDAELRTIRSTRGIEAPAVTCRACGYHGPGRAPRVSVRAMLLALGRFGIVSKQAVKPLEKAWASERRAKTLDIHGKPAAFDDHAHEAT